MGLEMRIKEGVKKEGWNEINLVRGGMVFVYYGFN